MYRIISNPDDITPIFVADKKSELPQIAADGYDEQGTAALVLEDISVYMIDGTKTWKKL